MSTFPPIGDYAFLSNCDQSCLIAPDGSVEWLCLPRPDSPSVFGALLDRSAGSFRFGPANAQVPQHRRYVPGTMVLETTWQTPTGWLVVHDLLVMGPAQREKRRADYHRAPTDFGAVGFWRDWLSTAKVPDHPWRAYIDRSALTLKGLSYSPTGAIMAAATTSLPETPGGARNWDYRYTWIRDSAFMLRSLYRLGFDWEAVEFFGFLIDAVSGGDLNRQFELQIMYGIGGERDLTERTLDHLSGYRAGPCPVPEAAVIRRAAAALRRGDRRRDGPAPGEFPAGFHPPGADRGGVAAHRVRAGRRPRHHLLTAAPDTLARRPATAHCARSRQRRRARLCGRPHSPPPPSREIVAVVALRQAHPTALLGRWAIDDRREAPGGGIGGG
jgi:Trehalase-like, N-terminal/Glycosyl hydrolases family 15